MYSTRSMTSEPATRGHLEPVEDRAAAVVADDQLEARLVLDRRQQQRADVVQHREVAEQHARDARAARRTGSRARCPSPWRSCRRCRRGRGWRAPAPSCRGSTCIGDAHQPRRAEDEPVVRPGRPPHGVDQRRAVERRADDLELGGDGARAAPRERRTTRPSASGAGGVRSTDAARDACSHSPSQSRSGSPVATATRSAAIVTPLRLSGSPGPRTRDDLDIRIGQQRRGLAAEGRVPEHDRRARCARRARGRAAARGSRARGGARSARR